MENRGSSGTIAGVLSIVSGALGILSGIFFAAFTVFFLKMFSGPSFSPGMQEMPEQVLNIMAAVYGLTGFVIIIIGVLGIIGGIFALKRKLWGLALAGTIAGAVTFFPCGIAAVIFVCLGKSEFINKKPVLQTGDML